MNTTQTSTAIDAINALDLAPIKTKLMHVASGEGWTADHTDTVEAEYRRFLTLMKLYPNEATAPQVDVDTFWHYHILDTAKYAADCAAAFGYFLHHYPYLGLEGEADAAARDSAGARMQELYAATFGASKPTARAGDAAWCGVTASRVTAWCGATTTASAGQAVAWCGVTAAAPRLAWCGSATAAPQLAWCGAAGTAPAQAAVAWCGATTTAPAAHALAWCGAAVPATVQVSRDVLLTVKQAA